MSEVYLSVESLRLLVVAWREDISPKIADAHTRHMLSYCIECVEKLIKTAEDKAKGHSL